MHPSQETVRLGIDPHSHLDVHTSQIKGRAATPVVQMTKLANVPATSRFFDASIIYVHVNHEVVHTARIKAKDGAVVRLLERIATLVPRFKDWYDRIIHTEIVISEQQFNGMTDVKLYFK